MEKKTKVIPLVTASEQGKAQRKGVLCFGMVSDAACGFGAWVQTRVLACVQTNYLVIGHSGLKPRMHISQSTHDRTKAQTWE